jgi:hypothetical protein
MKLIITLCLLAFVHTSVLGQGTTGQASPPPAQRRYALLDYIKIEPGKNADYRKMEQEVWMPIHRERIKAGIITGWALWGVGFPGGTAREYDVVGITYFPNLTAVENSYPPEIFTKAHPNMTAAERNSRTAPTRRIVRSELITILETSVPPPGAQATPAKYLQLNFMKAEPDKAAEYVAFARKYYKPMWQERINQGKMNRWVLAAVRYPAGTGREYNYIGADYFDIVEDLDATLPGLFQKVHPNANQAEFSAQNLALRKQVRVELLRLLEHVQ